MKRTSYLILGLMSGSSLDGVDIALCSFTLKGRQWTYKILDGETYPYEKSFANELSNSAALSAKELMALSSKAGAYYGEQLMRFANDHAHLFPKNEGFDFSVVHGHTVYHEPGVFSYQLGDGAQVAHNSLNIVVTDLRSADVAAGGNGAPIVSFADEALFPDHDALLNIGGIANITINGSNPIAYDICPANQVLNFFAKNLGQPYDDEGKLARTGNLLNDKLTVLNRMTYFQKDPPKSLDNSYTKEILQHFYECKDLDSLATYTHFMADLVAQAIGNSKKVLVTGGGAHNSYLIELIKKKTSAQIDVPDSLLVDYKESMAIAFMGMLRIRREINTDPQFTGASDNTISGAVYLPKNPYPPDIWN